MTIKSDVGEVTVWQAVQHGIVRRYALKFTSHDGELDEKFYISDEVARALCRTLTRFVESDDRENADQHFNAVMNGRTVRQKIEKLLGITDSNLKRP